MTIIQFDLKLLNRWNDLNIKKKEKKIFVFHLLQSNETLVHLFHFVQKLLSKTIAKSVNYLRDEYKKFLYIQCRPNFLITKN